MTRLFAPLFIVLALAGCESTTSADPDGPRLDLSKVEWHYFGTPEGIPPSPPVSGLYSPEVSDTPETNAVLAAVPEVSLALSDIAAHAQSWREADAEIQEYLRMGGKGVDDLPKHINEQIAAQVMWYGGGLSDVSEDPSGRETVLRYLNQLVENRFPNPLLAEGMLDIVEDDLTAQETTRLAQGVIDAHALHVARMNEKYEVCSMCRDRDQADPALENRDETWEDALGRLRARTSAVQ